MTAYELGWGLGGVALLALGWVCWSGRWRTWAELTMIPGVPPAALITFLPCGGLVLVAYGFHRVLPFWLTFAIAVPLVFASPVILVLAVWNPDWLGPRWYRRFKRAFAEPKGGDLTWWSRDPRQSGESSVEATRRHLESARSPPRSQSARLVRDPSARLASPPGVDGEILFFPHAPVFAARGAEGRSVEEIIAAESLQSAYEPAEGSVLGGSESRPWFHDPVCVDTAEGTWLFETRRAKHLAREIHRRYIDDSTGPYGVKGSKRSPLPDDQGERTQ